ncbi:hypothetical protein IWQ56_001882 [Coemansia nantahalensis]|uniref:Uncharacterized protein n=2 Tax=Coemansia TaxID=4863 RepID=A0ACC1JLR3_9FUNG|nr:hypothetical protein IWQ57_005701 [Coemansia nantahalensis]KAJ2771192.1 hypothetical protein IWQ56_001882 [Coemansia nantahalensis]
MDYNSQSDAGKESDIDVILEDDVSDSGENGETETFARERCDGAGGSAGKAGEKERTARKGGPQDDEPGCPYLPRLKTSIIQVVLNINAELVRLCSEYQNNSLMDDPQLVMYQMRLQSNLAYLASVADHYMDPTRVAPDLRPLPKPDLPSCQGSSIVAKLAHAREVYAAYATAWAEKQMELSRSAKARLHAEEKAQFAKVDRDHLHEHVEELLKKDRVAHDKSGDEPVTPATYRPFPPFRLPKDTTLPPGLQRWAFSNNTAAPDGGM